MADEPAPPKQHEERNDSRLASSAGIRPDEQSTGGQQPLTGHHAGTEEGRNTAQDQAQAQAQSIQRTGYLSVTSNDSQPQSQSPSPRTVPPRPAVPQENDHPSIDPVAQRSRDDPQALDVPGHSHTPHRPGTELGLIDAVDKDGRYNQVLSRVEREETPDSEVEEQVRRSVEGKTLWGQGDPRARERRPAIVGVQNKQPGDEGEESPTSEDEAAVEWVD